MTQRFPKKLAAALTILFLAICAACTSIQSSKNMTGTYVAEIGPNQICTFPPCLQLQLNSDGKYEMIQFGTSSTGRYEVHGNELTLINLEGVRLPAKIEGDDILLGNEDIGYTRYVKKK